jgi:pyruvate dehydrogenase phosphatase
MVIGSDGLWDLVKPEEICEIIMKNKNKSLINRYISNLSLKKACQLANMQLSELLKLPPGNKKRRIHDDITVMVVDLKNQVNKKN